MNSYRFKVGAFECMAVSDGVFTYPDPAHLLFVNAPEELLGQALREHNLQPEQWEQWISPYICLLINTGERRVLVDTGAGGFDPSNGKLLQNLQTEGIAPGDIDTVILTHGHPDHIGGNTDSEGKLIFPNARFVMWKTEWDFWTPEPDLGALELDEHLKELLITFARKNLPPIQERLDLVDHETEIVPGIHAIPVPGHTPGHMALAISSGDERLLYVSDTVLHPIHLDYPDWYAAFDFAAEQAMTSRRQLIDRAEAEKALVLAFHFPFPGLGRVIKKGEGWQWQPIETGA